MIDDTSQRKWIFSRPMVDMAWIHLPGLVGMTVAAFNRDHESTWFLIYGFIVIVALDAGHVYATLFRTYFDPDERRRGHVYLFGPPVVFGLTFLATRKVGFISVVQIFFVIQAFHAIRQFYGISKWYQMRNGISRKGSDFFLYTLCILPLFIMIVGRKLHFGPNAALEMSPLDAHSPMLRLYGVVVMAWICYELNCLRRTREINRLLSVALPGLFYAFFLFSGNLVEAGFPVLISHAVTYLAVTDLALKKTSPSYANRARATLGMIGLSIFLGILVYFGGRAALVSVAYAPFFCHVLFDSIIWRRSHPSAAMIYA